jgi:hypothetical protein
MQTQMTLIYCIFMNCEPISYVTLYSTQLSGNLAKIQYQKLSF